MINLNTKIMKILTSFLLLIFSQCVFAQWTLTNGVGTANGNTIYTINNDIYAGTDFGAYKSTNNGDNWTLINEGFIGTSHKVYDFSYSNSTLWCAAYNSGLYFSTNNGTNWIREFGAFTIVPKTVLAVQQYVVSTTASNIISTTNTGSNWLYMNQGSTPSISNGLSLGVKANTIYAGAFGVSFSFLGGTSWTNISGNLSGSSLYVNKLRIANDKIYIATNAGIFSSTNNGTNWINLYPALTSTSIYSLSILNSNIFISTQSKVYFSSNDGINWSDISTGLPSNPNVTEITYNDQYIFVMLKSGAVYKMLKSSIIGIHYVNSIVPSKFFLSQNYPNPFNPTTNIKFSLPEKSFVRLKIFDSRGREVSNLLNQSLSAGTYKYDFTLETLTSGIYFYKLETEKFTETKKMILLK